jgi:hypothetical protein
MQARRLVQDSTCYASQSQCCHSSSVYGNHHTHTYICVCVSLIGGCRAFRLGQLRAAFCRSKSYHVYGHNDHPGTCGCGAPAGTLHCRLFGKQELATQTGQCKPTKSPLSMMSSFAQEMSCGSRSMMPTWLAAWTSMVMQRQVPPCQIRFSSLCNSSSACGADFSQHRCIAGSPVWGSHQHSNLSVLLEKWRCVHWGANSH